MNPRPRVSVIIAARNAAATIEKCLTALGAQKGVNFEIIVADDESSDGTRATARSFDHVRVLELDWGGPSRARNLGVRAARGEIVAFTDADCVPHPNWLRELVRCFDDPDVAGAGGDQVSPEDETPFGRRVQEFFKTIGFMTDYIQSGASPGTIGNIRGTTHNPSCSSAYRKAVFEEVGGFSENQFPGEDVELDLKLRRLGHKLVYNPAAVVGHYRPRNCRALASMMRRYGAGERRLVRKYGFLRPLDFLPFFISIGGLVLAVVTVCYPATWPVILAPWLAALGCFWVRTRDIARSLQYTLFLTIAVACWNWGFVREAAGEMGAGR
jgi:glycosyltransferase involved in cell wall biosynthesis